MVRGISEALCTYGSGSRSRGVADIKRIGTNFDKLTRGPTRAMDFETAKKSSCPLSFPFLPFRAPRPLLYLSNPPLPTRPVPFIFFEMTSEVIRWGNCSEDWKLRLKWNCQLAFSFSRFVWEKIKRRKIGEGILSFDEITREKEEEKDVQKSSGSTEIFFRSRRNYANYDVLVPVSRRWDYYCTTPDRPAFSKLNLTSG